MIVTASGRPFRRRTVALCFLLLALLAFCYVAVHLRLVHNRAYEYRWTPSPAAPRIQFAGRDYNRAEPARRTSLPADVTPLGRTEGGGRIFGRGPAHGRVPVVLYVVTEDGTFSYGLSGGP